MLVAAPTELVAMPAMMRGAARPPVVRVRMPPAMVRLPPTTFAPVPTVRVILHLEERAAMLHKTDMVTFAVFQLAPLLFLKSHSETRNRPVKNSGRMYSEPKLLVALLLPANKTTPDSAHKEFRYMEFPAIWTVFGWSRTEWTCIQ